MRCSVFLVAVAVLSGTVAAQQGEFLDLVVTTDDGDSVVEEGEAAIITLYVDMSAATLLGLRSATFDTMGGENADTGGISEWSCLNGLCDVNGDTTMTDDVNLFGTNLLQHPNGPSFSKDDPIAVFRFLWKTEDFTPRTVRYHTLTSSMTFWIDETNWVPAGVAEADVAFCVGACVDDVPPDLPFGMEHETLGTASFGVDDRGRIALAGLGDAGTDGVRAATAGAEFHRFEFDPADIGVGESIRFTSMAAGTDFATEVLETRVDMGSSFFDIYVCIGVKYREYNFELTAFNGGEMVYTTTCDGCSFELEPIIQGPPNSVCAVTPHHQVGNARIINIELVQPSTISVFDGAEIVADRVEIGVLGVDAPEPTHTRVLPIGVDSLSIIEENFGAFGVAHRSLDGSKLNYGGTLTIMNIGSSGEDGVSAEHGMVDGFSFGIPKPPSSPGEAFRYEGVVQDAQTGGLRLIVGGNTDYDNPGNMWTFSPDFAQLGSPQGAVVCEAWLDGEIVGVQFGTVNAPPVVGYAEFVEAEYGSAIDGVGTLQKYTLFQQFGTPLMANDGRGNPIGLIDRVRCYLENQQLDVLLAESRVRVVGYGEIIIVSENVISQACFADCDGNGTLNILDFVCYQNLFTSGDLAADCDGNNALNILDFVCFQNAFVGGCP